MAPRRTRVYRAASWRFKWCRIGQLVHWLYLGVACVFEVVFALGSNAAKGFTRPVPSAITIAAAAGGIYMLSLALRTLEVGVGYTIWTGVGAIGTVALGAILFGERLTIRKVAAFAAIIIGVAGLKVVSGA